MGDSKVIRQAGFRWEGVPVEGYGNPGAAGSEGVTRQVLVGGRGEPLDSVTRYFELPAGSTSSLERHAHAHSVVVLRGRGEVVLGEAVHPIEPYDCVYVAPGESHQFRASGREALGFLCIVDRERPRPGPGAG